MASQIEVADAFFAGETTPYAASNFRMHTTDGGLTAYLVGDESVVYARREPMGQYTVYERRPYWSFYRDSPVQRSMMMSAIQDQHQLVIHRTRASNHSNRDTLIDSQVHPVTDFDDLEHLHP